MTLLLLLAAPAAGWFPDAQRVARAAAEANRAAGRDQPLEIDVEVGLARPGHGFPPEGAPERPAASPEALGRGTLWADPAGRARLELFHREGFRERHLLQEGVREAARDGQPLEDPLPLLPPLAPLQAGRGAELLIWLASQGAPRDAELAPAGVHDAVVLGRRRDGAALWVAQEGWQLVRIDTRGGAHFHLGPERDFGDVRLPAWIAIEAPGQPELRMTLRAARSASASDAAFSRAWLREPVSAPPGPATTGAPTPELDDPPAGTR